MRRWHGCYGQGVRRMPNGNGQITGESENTFSVLVERAGRMLLKSGLNSELPDHVLSEQNPINRWFEFVCSGQVLRQDGEGYDKDESGQAVHYTSGRLLKGVQKS